MANGFLGSILAWLRAGYPEGVPESDYVPLFALLSRRLSSDEVHEVARAIVHKTDGEIDHIDIGVEITKFTDELPRDEDIDRVRARLAAGGWPLADPTQTD